MSTNHNPRTGGFARQRRNACLELLAEDPKLYLLISQIGMRARWKTDGVNPHNLGIGEALIGDHGNCGLTRQEYRSAIRRAKKWGIATFKATSSGTVATLINHDYYDLSEETSNHQDNQPATTKQPSSNHQPTTNIEGEEGIEGEKCILYRTLRVLLLRHSQAGREPEVGEGFQTS